MRGSGRWGRPGRWLAGFSLVLPLACLMGPGIGLAATDTIVTIRGDIVPACSIAGLATSVNLGDLTSSGATTLAFTATCNAPFSYSLESAFGGMRHSSGATAPAGLAALLPYTVRAILPTDAATIDNTCTSPTIRAGSVTCSFSDSGTGIAIDAASELRLGWTGASNLLGGSYSDTLTLTIGIRP